MIGCPALTPKELKLALANLHGRYALRDRALVTLGVRTGLRISELLALKVGQVWDGKRTVARFYVAGQATKGKHAGASIVLHPDAAKAVARWIKAGGLAANPQGYLFPSQKNAGRRLGRKSAWGLLHSAFQKAGVTGMAGRFHVIVSGSDGAFDAKGPIFKHPLGSRRRFIRKVTNGTLKNFRPLPDSL